MESELYREIIGEGKVEGMAEGTLPVLDVRGVPMSATLRARILSRKDPATPDVWIRRAAVTSIAAAVVRAKAPARRASPARQAPKT